jgi:hypothetical protein
MKLGAVGIEQAVGQPPSFLGDSRGYRGRQSRGCLSHWRTPSLHGATSFSKSRRNCRIIALSG